MAKRALLVGAVVCLGFLLCAFSPSIREQVVSVACSQLGIMEEMQNRGKVVDIYIDHCEVQPPIPWCGCFCKFVFDSCGLQSPPIPQLAASWFTSHIIKEPNPASNVGFYFNSMHGIHHVGILESIYDQDIVVIAGNTNDRSINEGDKVMKKRYPITQNIYFSDWINSGRPDTYTVKPQDTIYHISTTFGVPISELMAKNHLDSYRIQVGQKIEL